MPALILLTVWTSLFFSMVKGSDATGNVDWIKAAWIAAIAAAVCAAVASAIFVPLSIRRMRHLRMVAEMSGDLEEEELEEEE